MYAACVRIPRYDAQGKVVNSLKETESGRKDLDGNLFSVTMTQIEKQHCTEQYSAYLRILAWKN